MKSDLPIILSYTINLFSMATTYQFLWLSVNYLYSKCYNRKKLLLLNKHVVVSKYTYIYLLINLNV